MGGFVVLFCLLCGWCEVHGVEGALFLAVAAGYASCVVDGECVDVYAGCFAVAFAFAAFFALVGVDGHLEV